MNNLIPDGWKNRIFSDAMTLSYGKSPKEIFADNGIYPVIGTGGITGYTNNYLHEGHTTVVGRKGSINNPSFINDKFWAIDTTYYASNYKDTDAKWFFYLLQSIDLTKYNEASGVPSLNRDTLYSISFIAPPLPEQQKIATILTSVDDVIEKTQAQIDKLKDLKTGMMQELLTRGVGVDGKPHTEFKDSSVGKIPKGWDVVSLETLVKADKKITYGIVQAGPHHENGTPYIRVSDMSSRYLNKDGMLLTSPEIAKKYERSAVNAGDIVYALRGMIGHVQIVPTQLSGANLTQGTARISPNDNINTGYLFWAMKSPYVAMQNDLEAKGSTFKEVTLASLRNIQIAIPERAEQEYISAALDSIQSKIFVIEDRLAQSKNLKKALMQDLLTGKVRVKLDS